MPHLQTAVPVLPTGKGDCLGRARAGCWEPMLECRAHLCAASRWELLVAVRYLGVQMLKHMYPISGASLNAVGNV